MLRSHPDARTPPLICSVVLSGKTEVNFPKTVMTGWGEKLWCWCRQEKGCGDSASPAAIVRKKERFRKPRYRFRVDPLSRPAPNLGDASLHLRTRTLSS